MAKALRPLDITASPELLRLVEEVERSGEGRLLKRGEQDVAVLTPVAPRGAPKRPPKRRQAPIDYSDPIFNIIGMISTDEPTDVAANKHQYLAEAFWDEFHHPPGQ